MFPIPDRHKCKKCAHYFCSAHKKKMHHGCVRAAPRTPHVPRRGARADQARASALREWDAKTGARS